MLGFESPRTGYCFNKFLSLGLRSLRTLFLKFVAVLRHTLVLCYIAPIPFRTTSMIFRSVALPLEILISHFVPALTLDLLQISRERFFCNDPSISCHPPRNLICVYHTCFRLFWYWFPWHLFHYQALIDKIHRICNVCIRRLLDVLYKAHYLSPK